MKIVLWELRSASDMPARCAHQYDHGAHLVTVHVGETERFHEQHCTEAEAHDEATHLLDHFMLKGWTDVMYRDPRIAFPEQPVRPRPRDDVGRWFRLRPGGPQ